MRLGVDVQAELHAGKQSRLFTASIDGEKLALKLTDARLASRSALAEKMAVVEELADDVDSVVAPRRIAGELVRAVGAWLVTATPFVEGTPPDVTNRTEARMMGRTLAMLHDALARLPARDLPPVAALDVSGADIHGSGWQLLHGDFSDQNTIVTDPGLRIFDFDDCGFGPVAFDLANSLFMVLFDSEVHGRHGRFEAFRPALLEGYAEAAGTAVDHAAVDSLIDVRVGALGRWLDDLHAAPIGIRTSSPEWLETLRGFVASHTASGSFGGS